MSKIQVEILTKVHKLSYRDDRPEIFYLESPVSALIDGVPLQIEPGYATDFASSGIGSHRMFFGRSRTAAIIHDCLCTAQAGGDPFSYDVSHYVRDYGKKCILFNGVVRDQKWIDSVFHSALHTLGVAHWRAELMYRAVRAYSIAKKK